MRTHDASGTAPELSRPVRLAAIDRGDALDLEIAAAPAERAALARRFGLLELGRLEARARLRRRGAVYHVEGSLSADATQACVVTLDPVPAHVEHDFSLSYTRDPSLAAPADAIDMDVAGDDDPPELVERDWIDIGEAVAQELAVALEPYPRSPDAALEAAAAGPPRESPFAGLAPLRPRQ